MLNIVLFLAFALVSSAVAADTLSVGTTAPDFTLNSLKGEEIHLKQLRDRTVFLNFWATWCAPCRKELPELERFYRTYKDSGLVVLAVNVDQQRSNVENFLVEAKIDSLIVLLDPAAKAVGLYNPQGMPASFLIDRQGVIRYRHLGFSREVLQEYEEQVEQLIRR